MPPALTQQELLRLVHRIDPRAVLKRSWSLKGGVSAQVTGLEVERGTGTLEKWVVRQHGEGDLKSNPNIAADEFKLLTLLQSTGFRAPKPYSVDQSGAICATPYIVLEYIQGTSDFAPANLDDFLRQTAITLAQIHRLEGATPELAFLPEFNQRQTEKLRQRPAQLDDSLSEGRIRSTLETVWPLAQLNRSTLLHGDYWPGNLLWQESKLAAVIDWEDAALGDPLTDLAYTRLELLWTFDSAAMQHFTDYYQAAQPTLDYTNLPYWDLCAALRPASKIADWARDSLTEQKMRAGHQGFISQAFASLPTH